MNPANGRPLEGEHKVRPYIDWLKRKLPPMPQFVLPPFDFPFSGHNPRPHAQARLTVGGKTRNFVLKIHDRTLYFKEPARAPIWALLDEFEPTAARDSIGLVSKWQRAVDTHQFGAFVSRRDYFPKLPVRAQILLLLQPDGSGWMREHFDRDWFLLPDDGAAPLDVWNEREVEARAKDRLPAAQRQLINRALSPETLSNDPPRWLAASGDEIARVVIAAATLFLSPDAFWNEPDNRVLKIRSHSQFARGDIEGRFLKHALHSPQFARVWELLEPQIQFVGIHWREGGEESDQYVRPRNEAVYSAGLEKWGQLWRGNWAPTRAIFPITIPEIADISAHEKLEAGLVLRDWLRGWMGEGEIEALLQAQ